jgi:hypothetical protein
VAPGSGANSNGVVLDAGSGKEHYAGRSGGPIWATPLAAGDRIYLFGRDGATTVLRRGPEYQVLAECRVWPEATPAAEVAGPPGKKAQVVPAGSVLYAAAAAGKKLLIRSGDRLYCVGD